MHFTADQAQQAIRRANLVLLSSTSQKISTGKNLAKVAAEAAKRSWIVRVRRRKRFRLNKNCLLRSSPHQSTVSSGDIHAHPRAVIPSFASNRGHVTRK